jgi:hypothetical protein
VLPTGVSRVYLLLVTLTALQPALFVLDGALSGLSTGGATFVACLLVWLAYRSRVAWALLVVTNAVPLLAATGLAVTTPPWSWSITICLALLSGALLEAVLLSPAMRRELDRRGPVARQPRQSQLG